MLKKTLVPLFFLSLLGCNEEDYKPLSFNLQGTDIVATGVIDAGSLTAFKVVIENMPDARTLVLKNVSGSADDIANIQFSRFIRDHGFSTRVPSDGLIASGGTDLFLAGVSRILEPGACVGIHSWSDEKDGELTEGRDFPRDSDFHKLYLEYYESINIPAEFYWFTLEAAPADGMYWMSRVEVMEYRMATQNPGALSDYSVCDSRIFSI